MLLIAGIQCGCYERWLLSKKASSPQGHCLCFLQMPQPLYFDHVFLFYQIKECADEPVGKGFLVSCLVDHRGNITEYQCHQYITKMTAIIFSDYRLICGFMDDCKADINLLKCGSIRPGEKVSRDADGGGQVLLLARSLFPLSTPKENGPCYSVTPGTRTACNPVLGFAIQNGSGG